MTSTTRQSRASRSAAQNASQATVTPPTAEQIAAALTAAGVSEADQAKMMKSVQPKAPKLNVKRHVAAELVKVAADLAESWDATAHEGISAEDATKIIAQRLAYGPAGVWDDRLGERSDAGRRPKNGDDSEPTESESE